MAEDERDERKGIALRLAEGLAKRSGAEVVDEEELGLMEAQVADRRLLMKEMDAIAWRSMDYIGGNEQDLRAVERRNLVQKARVAWQQDPQLGASVDLNNDFVLGRGVPKPRAKDPEVQKVLDDAWEDPDNKLVLTSYEAQMALNTDLSLQSNVFLLLFDSGEDGKIKVGVLDHDSVENVVRDTDNRRKVLWYVARERRLGWDFTIDGPRVLLEDEGKTRAGTQRAKDNVLVPDDSDSRVRYYEHWAHEADKKQTPPKEKIGEGKVYHVALNRTGEMAFGHPTMHRVIRWTSAFNSLMEARVDLAKAAAAMIMKRKVKGTPNQVRKIAEQALSRRSEIGRSVGPEGTDGSVQGPRAGSVINENEAVEHSPFNLDTGASNANTDGQMIRSQISAATHWPQHYLGDVGSASLANSLAMELPVIRAVASRQEIIEQIFRWFCDRSIERAIEKGALKPDLTDAEMAEKTEREEGEGKADADTAPPESPEVNPQNAPVVQEASLDLNGDGPAEEETEDPEDKKRDLTYDFSLPNPQRRMLSELVNSVSNVAKTFDPNGTNMDLSRLLLNVVLGEGLELDDPAEAVEKVFPPGYKDPALEAMEKANAAGGGGGGAPPGMTMLKDGEQPPGKGEPATDTADNPYGAKTHASTPEDNPYGSVMEARLKQRGRDFDVEAGRILESIGDDA